MSDPCQYPKAARLALMVLASPAVDIEIIHAPSLKTGQINYKDGKAEVWDPVIGEGNMRSLNIEHTQSVNDLLYQLRANTKLRATHEELVDSIGAMHNNLIKLAEAGLHDQRLPAPAQHSLAVNIEKTTRLMGGMGLPEELAMPVLKLMTKIKEVSSMMQEEQKRGAKRA